jgi:hypothetical protein
VAFTLLVLAAGQGSRYGGLKQIDPVGPSGETLLDYAVFDALATGCTRVVFVIRREFEAAFREKVGAKYSGRVDVAYVFQSPEALPAGFAPVAGREKPWGTGHAVWCAASAVRDNFAVINADDFYGKDSFARLAAFFASVGSAPAALPRFALVGFRLAHTLSEHGAVSRGVCTAAGGLLQSVVEQKGIEAADVGPGRTYAGTEIVSMNCWAFSPALFPLLEADLREFLQARGADLQAEFYLPAAVSAMIGRGQAVVEVLPTSASWFGITYRPDRPRVAAAIAELVAAKEYPSRLF